MQPVAAAASRCPFTTERRVGFAATGVSRAQRAVGLETAGSQQPQISLSHRLPTSWLLRSDQMVRCERKVRAVAAPDPIGARIDDGPIISFTWGRVRSSSRREPRAAIADMVNRAYHRPDVGGPKRPRSVDRIPTASGRISGVRSGQDQGGDIRSRSAPNPDQFRTPGWHRLHCHPRVGQRPPSSSANGLPHPSWHPASLDGCLAGRHGRSRLLRCELRSIPISVGGRRALEMAEGPACRVTTVAEPSFSPGLRRSRRQDSGGRAPSGAARRLGARLVFGYGSRGIHPTAIAAGLEAVRTGTRPSVTRRDNAANGVRSPASESHSDGPGNFQCFVFAEGRPAVGDSSRTPRPNEKIDRPMRANLRHGPHGALGTVGASGAGWNPCDHCSISARSPTPNGPVLPRFGGVCGHPTPPVSTSRWDWGILQGGGLDRRRDNRGPGHQRGGYNMAATFWPTPGWPSRWGDSRNGLPRPLNY